MALRSLVLRRNLHRYLVGIPLAIFPRSSSSSSSSPLISHGSFASVQSSTSPLQQQWPHFLQSRSFKSSPVTQWSSRSISNSKDDEIGPDTILFEGCDYNHWLIVMDFPRDNKPPPEEMIRTYEETCAKGLGISVEEAKKKMYACSTTTYTGFQALMTEEESEKFNGLPGVIFVLPDSYIDPQNKEYGGDKYIDGTIIPRPPPVQYGRQTGRYRDRNRYPDQPRYDRQGAPVPNQQGNPNYGQQQGRMEGGRNYGPPPNYASPQQNYSPPAQNYGPPQQQNYGPPQQQNYGPPQPQNYGPPQPQNYGPPGKNYASTQQQNYGPPGQNYTSAPQQNYNPPGQMERRDSMPMNSGGGRDSYQSGRGGPMPPYQGDYNQGGQGYFPHGDQRNNAHNLQGGFNGHNRNYGPAQGSPYGQEDGGYSGQTTPEPGQGPNWTNRA